MNNKKKIIAICVCVALLAGTILSGTIAYFTDKEAITNTFTSGNVMIDLDEYTNDGLVEGTTDGLEDLIDPENNIFNKDTFKLYPADVYTKKPIITVDADSERAFVAAKIEIKAGDLTKTTVGGTDMPRDDVFQNPAPLVVGGKLDIKQLLTGGVLDSIEEVDDAAAAKTALADPSTDKYVMFQKFDSVTGTYTFYVYANAIKSATNEIELFNTLSIPPEWDNAEMDELEALDITVKAFATQEKHLDNCYKAMYSAFPGDFPNAEGVIA